jgi:hypothetical protein
LSKVIAIASNALDTFKSEAKNMVVALVDMERAFVPPQHFIRLVQRRSVSLLMSKKKGQPSVRSTRLHNVWGRVRPLWVLCTQPFPVFLQEAISRT